MLLWVQRVGTRMPRWWSRAIPPFSRHRGNPRRAWYAPDAFAELANPFGSTREC